MYFLTFSLLEGWGAKILISDQTEGIKVFYFVDKISYILELKYFVHHTVEKAALVFSLKLDSGHKLLCPWVDNACDEKLVQFPPMSSTDLVANYQKRFSMLLQLSALPLISSSAIEYMRNPQFEHFINEFSVEFGKNKSTDSSTMEFLENETESASSALYYQVSLL